MRAQIFNSTTELTIPTGTPTNEANAETERMTDSRNKSKKMFEIIQSPTHFFMVIVH